MKFRSDWQEMKEHDRVVRATLRETGVVGKDGSIRVFHGAAFYERMEAQDHTAMDYDRCSCRPSGWEWLTIPEMERRGIPTGVTG